MPDATLECSEGVIHGLVGTRTTFPDNLRDLSVNDQLFEGVYVLEATVGGGTQFDDFVRRIRAGDEEAAVALVHEYEPLVRREIRMRLVDPRLARAFDTMDICQSVWASFFVRTAAGQFDLDEPGQLLKLLVTMARNKLASAARDENRDRRDHRRVDVPVAGTWSAVVAGGATPSRVIEARDLLRHFMNLLSPEERQLAEFRAQQISWNDIAERMGGTAQGRRMQFSRAVDRAAMSLGLEDAPL
ncbi:MAG TPA: ECF-type sigma factor [Pirellulaceae bacterium]